MCRAWCTTAAAPAARFPSASGRLLACRGCRPCPAVRWSCSAWSWPSASGCGRRPRCSSSRTRCSSASGPAPRTADSTASTIRTPARSRAGRRRDVGGHVRHPARPERLERGRDRRTPPAVRERPGSPSRTTTPRYFDPDVPERYDMVFFDQRGIGRSQPLQCLQASLAWYTTPESPTGPPAEAEAFAAATERTSPTAWPRAGVLPEDLPLYATAQAVEDLEVFRQWHGAEQVILIRRELRHPVRPGLRGRAPGPGPGPDHRRTDRPHPQRAPSTTSRPPRPRTRCCP